MADAEQLPNVTATNMQPVASQSYHSTKSQETPNNTDSRAENDFVQMMNLIMEDPTIQNIPAATANEDNVQITIPQGRVASTKKSRTRHTHRRRGGSSMMGDKVINVRINIPETLSDEELTNEELPRSKTPTVATPVDGEIDSGELIDEIVDILKKSIHDRSNNEVDILVNYFEHFQIMSDDVDQWAGQHTFRALIRETRYKKLKRKQFVYKKDDDVDLCFYFVLKGSVKLCSDKIDVDDIDDIEDVDMISLTDHAIFGDKEMHELEPRHKNCFVDSHNVHLAYWAKDAYNDYIRPIKELNTNIKEEKGLLHDKYGNLLTENDLIEKASMFLDDAIHGRSFKMHRNGKWPRKVHRILIGNYFQSFIICICLLWLLLIFIEPPSSLVDNIPNKTEYKYIMQCILFEWAVFIIFLLECLARVFSYGSRWFFTNRLHAYRVVLLVIFLSDLSIATLRNGAWFRFSRIFRPFYLMLFIRDLRRQYFILLSCIPSVLELIMLYLAVVGIFARIGYHIFDHVELVYNRSEFLEGSGVYEEYLNGTPGSEDSLYVGIWESFSTFFLSSMTLFVLLTTENYPEVFWPAWLSKHVYYAYFVIYILISTFFLMNLFSASVYNAYQHIIAGLDVYDEGREATALRVAWNCLDYDEKGYIEKDRFVKLMRKLKPQYSQFEIGVLFKLMDSNGDGEIEVLEFSEMMINCLYFSISKRNRSHEDELKLYLQRLGAKLGPYGYDILSIFTSNTYSNIILLFVSLDVCFLLSYHFAPVLCDYGDTLCLCIIVINIFIDIVFKHQSKISRYFSTTKNKIFFVITLAQCIGTTIGIMDTHSHREPNYLSGLRFIGISRILLMASFLRERFSFLKHSTSNTLTQTVIYMIPVFLRICFYLYVGFIYIFIVFGMELFYDWNNHQTYGKVRCNGSKQMESDPAALFCDASATFITLFQILTTNNWHIIMYQAIETTDNYFVSIYFILFFVLGPILTVNFLLAVFFDMFFGVSLQHQDVDEEENIKDALLDAAQQKTAAALSQNDAIQTLHSMQSPDGSQLPTEQGISSLSDGTMILTVKRANVVCNNMDLQIIYDDDDDHEYVHLNLMDVAKTIWHNIAKKDYKDSSGNTYHNTFSGKEAVECILSLRYAPDEEDAIDYLAQIMEYEAVFSRIDIASNPNTKVIKNEFENEATAHYQWTMHFDDADDKKKNDENDDEHTKKDEILIGVRHSYGGFQRLMKQNRRVGAVPTAAAAAAASPDIANENNKNEIIKSTTTMFSDSETPRNVKTPKANIFSNRNLLSFQQQASVKNIHTTNSEKKDNEINRIKNGLMILFGEYSAENDAQSISKFETLYNFSVLRSKNIESFTVSKYFNIDKYDAIILSSNNIAAYALNLRNIYRLLTKKLNLKQLHKIPKLVIYVEDEFADEPEQKSDDDADQDESDAFDEDKEELLELFGFIETTDRDFSIHLINQLNNNKDSAQSITVLINKVRKLINSNVYLNHFDPQLLLYHIVPNEQ